MSAVVYVLVDSADQAIYVGASHDYGRRLSEHQRAWWWQHVASAEIYPQADWELALYVERNLIRRLSPEFNRQSVDPVESAMGHIFAPMFRSLAEAAR